MEGFNFNFVGYFEIDTLIFPWEMTFGRNIPIKPNILPLKS